MVRSTSPLYINTNVKPELTVLLSVYNGERFLVETIESILRQSYENFIFLIVDDGSTDKTSDILHHYLTKDKRINIITNQHSLGLTKSLNHGLKLIKTDYIARIDADDISLVNRLEKQLIYMKRNPDLVVLGCNYDIINENSEIDNTNLSKIYNVLSQHHEIMELLRSGVSIIAHPSMLIRTSALKEIGGYRECFKYAQDYDMLLRISKIGKLSILNEVLLKYRTHSNAISAKKVYEQQIYNISALCSDIIFRKSKVDPLDEMYTHITFSHMFKLVKEAGSDAKVRMLHYNFFQASFSIENINLLFIDIFKTPPSKYFIAPLEEIFFYINENDKKLKKKLSKLSRVYPHTITSQLFRKISPTLVEKFFVSFDIFRNR